MWKIIYIYIYTYTYYIIYTSKREIDNDSLYLPYYLLCQHHEA